MIADQKVIEQAAFRALEMMAAMRPRPSAVNKTQAAEMLNISLPTLRKLLARNVIRLNPAGMICTADIDAIVSGRFAA